jgi:TonB family protein
MGDFRQLSVRKGDNLCISRNAPFTPPRITELQDLLKVFSVDADHGQVKQVKRQPQSGIETECLEVRARSGSHAGNAKRELCINQTTKELLTHEVRDGQDYRRKEFSDYQPFGGHGYPRHLRLFVDGSQALDVRINSLRENEFDATVFVPPAGAIVRRQCEHMIHPVALKTPDPAYPRSASQNRIGGTATVALTVLPDGSVDNVQLIGSAGKEMDQITQEIVKTWKFKPAMCGNEPVASDIRVDMNFRLR